MKTVTRKATVSTAYGQTLAEPLEFEYSFDELQKGDTIPDDEVPGPDDIRTYVNQKRNAAARSTRQAQVLSDAGIQKPTLEDPNVAYATMVKVLKAQGQSQENAEKMAKQVLGL